MTETLSENKLATISSLKASNDVDISEPLSKLVYYIGHCIQKKQNPIFKNNFNLQITKILEKI